MKTLKNENKKIAKNLSAKSSGAFNWDLGAQAFDKKEKGPYKEKDIDTENKFTHHTHNY